MEDEDCIVQKSISRTQQAAAAPFALMRPGCCAAGAEGTAQRVSERGIHFEMEGSCSKKRTAKVFYGQQTVTPSLTTSFASLVPCDHSISPRITIGSTVSRPQRAHSLVSHLDMLHERDFNQPEKCKHLQLVYLFQL
jgi:hypothetical protein